MNLYLVNIGLIVVVLVVVVLVTVGLRVWRRMAWFGAMYDFLQEVRWQESGLEPANTDRIILWLAKRVEVPEYAGTAARIDKRYVAIARLFRLLNVVTTIAALVPLGFAVYNLSMNQQHQALNFNLAAIATLIVTKGGLFLLTWILLPAAKAVPGAIAGAVVKRKYDDWQKQRKNKQPGG